MKKLSEWQQIMLLGFGTLFIAILMFYGNTWLRCREQYLMGEKYYAAQDWMNAIVAYETAIHAYTPASSMVYSSAQRMWDIALQMEQAAETAPPEERDKLFNIALISLRSLRSSFYAVRSLYTPGKDWIKRCDGRIAQILEKQRIASGQGHLDKEPVMPGELVVPPKAGDHPPIR